MVTAVVAAYALVQRSAADREARATRARELAGQAELAIADDPERAIMLALAASETTSDPLPDSISALQAATQSMRLVRRIDGVGYWSLQYSPDGSMVAVDHGQDASSVDFVDPANGDVLAVVDTPYSAGWNGLAFDPGGAELAVAYADSGGDPAVGRFDVASGRAAGTYSGPAGHYDQLSFQPDGQWLGAVRRNTDGPGTEIVVWAVDSAGAPISLGGGTAYGFLPGTTSVVIAGGDDEGSFTVVDIETGEVVGSLEVPEDEYYSITIDPTGQHLAAMSTTDRVVVVDLESRQQIDLDVGFAQVAELSPDGQWLAISDSDSLVHLYDTENFAETLLAGSPNYVTDVSFAPDGSQLATISAGQLRFWVLAPEGHPALGNFPTSGPVHELVVAERSRPQ